MSRKAVTDSELTLAQSELSKYHVYFALQGITQGLLVAEEQHTGHGKHYHCYIQTTQPTTIKEIRLIIEYALYLDTETKLSIHISSLRNKKHWIKYITKEDTDPKYHYVDDGGFHQSWKISSFIKSNERFDTMHPFLRQNPSLINILYRCHSDFWSPRRAYDASRIIPEYNPDYRVSWDQRATEALLGGKHVYLHETIGMGKSTFAKTHTRQPYGVVNVPCDLTPFEFGDVDFDTPFVCAHDAPATYLLSHCSVLLQL